MVNVKKMLLSLLLGLSTLTPINAQTSPKLSGYAFKSASVLPTYTHKKAKYLILAREAYGKSKGTYDDFGGGRDPDEGHPVITAAREFFEEAIIFFSIGLTLAEIQKYINVAKTDNTECIVAYDHNVTYITKFDAYTKAFLKNFYFARTQVKDPHYKEKNLIALVAWEALKKVINNNKGNTGITIEAVLVHPKTKKLFKRTITLRPYFVKKLRPFFMNKAYKQGQNTKIRFYDASQTDDSYLSRFWRWLRS